MKDLLLGGSTTCRRESLEPLGPQIDQLPGLSHHIVYFFPNCALNRVCLYSLPTYTTGTLSRVYNHLPTTASNQRFRLSCIHLHTRIFTLYSGYFCTLASNSSTPVGYSEGDVCPLGHYCPVMTSVPIPCPTGTYLDSTLQVLHANTSI